MVIRNKGLTSEPANSRMREYILLLVGKINRATIMKCIMLHFMKANL